MGHIFDIHSAKLYEAWYRSQGGKAMDKLIERLIPELLEPQPYESVIDIGCGAGNHLLFLSKLGLNISGIDASPFMIDIARKRLGDRCTLKTGMAEDLPFSDNEFDLALLINTLEFVDDPSKVLREAGRVAKRKVFITITNSLSCYCVWNKFISLFGKTLFKHIKPRNLWGMKSCLKTVFGSAPTVWRSEQVCPVFSGIADGFLPDSWRISSWPFGAFLGFAVTIKYTMKADTLPLKMGVRKREQSIAGGIGMRIKEDERSIPV